MYTPSTTQRCGGFRRMAQQDLLFLCVCVFFWVMFQYCCMPLAFLSLLHFLAVCVRLYVVSKKIQRCYLMLFRASFLANPRKPWVPIFVV